MSEPMSEPMSEDRLSTLASLHAKFRRRCLERQAGGDPHSLYLMDAYQFAVMADGLFAEVERLKAELAEASAHRAQLADTLRDLVTVTQAGGECPPGWAGNNGSDHGGCR